MQNRDFTRYVPSLVWLTVLLVMLFIPFRIISYGYLPYDDALRHVAKAISGQPWSEILVLNPQFTLDHNHGWHVLLGFLHQTMGWQQEGLITFSVVFLFALFGLLPVFNLRRPEAWLGAFLLGLLVNPSVITRFLMGRPLVFSMAVLMLLCFLWLQTQHDSVRRPLLWGGTTVAIALAVWLHGAWYLFALPVLALLLAGWWRQAAVLAGCWLGGSLLGALFTGHPVSYLLQAVQIAGQALGQPVPQRLLASEFQPSDGVFPALVVIVLVFLTRKSVSGRWPAVFSSPLFLLVMLCWLLGLKVGRFWGDWGFPALLVWLAVNIQSLLEETRPADTFQNLAFSGFLAAAVFFHAVNDTGSRWTLHLSSEFLDASKPEVKALMPEAGGIIYSPDMTVFYQTFYQNPKAGWQYAVGFEPALMAADDLNVFRSYQWNYGDTRSLDPWVKKMRPQDRMILRGGTATVAPPGLVWSEGAKGLWIGRRSPAKGNP